MDYKDLNRVYCISLLLHGLYGLEDFGDRETLNFIRDGFDDEDFSDILSMKRNICIRSLKTVMCPSTTTELKMLSDLSP